MTPAIYNSIGFFRADARYYAGAYNQSANYTNSNYFNAASPNKFNGQLENLIKNLLNYYQQNNANNKPVDPNKPINPNTPLNPNTPVLAGGYSSVATNDPNVKSAADFAAKSLTNGQAGVKNISSAEQQVVAGMNYRMNIELTNGSKYNVTVYKDLQGGMSLTQSTPLK